MAKKILAAVLAVVVAISAMAVTAFADQRIDLIGKADSSAATTNNLGQYSVQTITFDIPVYPLYNYMSNAYKMRLYLPAEFNGNAETIDKTIDWSIIVNGQSFPLKSYTADFNWQNYNTGKTDEQDVFFGTGVHGYFKIGDTEYFATVPQATLPGQITTLRLVAAFTYKASETWRLGSALGNLYNVVNGVPGTYAYNMRADFINVATDEIESTSYAYTWQAAQGEADAFEQGGKYTFVNGAYTYASILDTTGNIGNKTWQRVTPGLDYRFTWDHTLENRAKLYGAEKVQLVVKLDKPLVGRATYNLWGVSSLLNYRGTTDVYWDYNSYVNRQFIASAVLDGTLDELVFDIPIDALNSSVYDFENVEFAITENIDLFDPAIMGTIANPLTDGGNAISVPGYERDYLKVDRNKVGAAAGTWGDISWGAQYGGTGESLLYKGTAVNYAFGGPATGFKTKATASATNVWGKPVWALNTRADGTTADGTLVSDFIPDVNAGASVRATDVYLNIVEAEVDTVEPTTPTEPGDQDSQEELDEGDDITVNDTDEETKGDENPKTGIALAVLPMLVSAAAAVVSKKH